MVIGKIRVPRRYLLMPLLAGAMSFASGSAIVWAAVLAFFTTAMFTVAQNLIRQHLFGKLGRSITLWWFFDWTLSTTALLLIVGLPFWWLFSPPTAIAIAGLTLSWLGLIRYDFNTWLFSWATSR